jgi:hypothetical protein
MHLLVPFASDRSEACQHVLRDLALPNLERLLALLTPAGRDEGDAGSFSPPHERALAAAWGWRGGDGLLPFAAHAAAGDGIATGDLAWALLTPSHWQLGRDDVTLLDPALLGLAEAESRALFASAGELLASEGFAVAWGASDRWYAARDDLQALATASLDRVIGRNVDRWVRASAHGAVDETRATLSLLRRLQSEAQIVFHSHAVNEAREERGELTANSFWLSGCGRRQPADARRPPRSPRPCARRCCMPTGRRGPRRGARSTVPTSRGCSRWRAAASGDADALRRTQRGSLCARAALALAAPANDDGARRTTCWPRCEAER